LPSADDPDVPGLLVYDLSASEPGVPAVVSHRQIAVAVAACGTPQTEGAGLALPVQPSSPVRDLYRILAAVKHGVTLTFQDRRGASSEWTDRAATADRRAFAGF
jgi:hypothetical protein